MTIDKRSKKRTMFIVAGILIGVVVSAAVFSAKRHQTKPQAQNQQPKEWLTSVPTVSSKIKDLEIINPRIVRLNTAVPGVAFEVRNNSNRAVMSIEIASGEGSIAKDGLENDEHPTVIIEPFGTLTAEMSGELNPDQPIVITAAVFADGKEEGDESSLSLMHKVRTMRRRE